MVLADVELAAAPGLLPHQGVDRDIAEAVMPREPPILPLHSVFNVILVGDAALPGFDKIRNTPGKQGGAG